MRQHAGRPDRAMHHLLCLLGLESRAPPIPLNQPPRASPPCRRAEQMQATGGDELAAVRQYFDTAGFERWNKIYGETDEVNKVCACSCQQRRAIALV